MCCCCTRWLWDVLLSITFHFIVFEWTCTKANALVDVRWHYQNQFIQMIRSSVQKWWRKCDTDNATKNVIIVNETKCVRNTDFRFMSLILNDSKAFCNCLSELMRIQHRWKSKLHNLLSEIKQWMLMPFPTNLILLFDWSRRFSFHPISYNSIPIPFTFLFIFIVTVLQCYTDIDDEYSTRNSIVPHIHYT